jgi:threonine aldolase
MRYVACQFLAYLDNDLWARNARHANDMAQLLRAGIASAGDFEFTQPTDANVVLVKMPKLLTDRLLKKHFFYVWNEAVNEIRLVTSWDTCEKDIEMFVNDTELGIENRIFY